MRRTNSQLQCAGPLQVPQLKRNNVGQARAVTIESIRDLVDVELRRVRDGARREALAACIVKPESHVRTWAYGPGEYECWTVASGRGTVLVYSQAPFADRWGALAEASTDLGMDSDWFATLDDAFIRGIWTGARPPGYEVR